MGQLQGWMADTQVLTALTALVIALGAAFVAGYVVGRAGREGLAPRPAPPASRRPDDVEALPEIGGDEADLMDLTGIRGAEPEPPPPLDLGPPPRR